MNKEVVKEFKGDILGINILLYIIFAVIGFFMVQYDEIYNFEPENIIYLIFYTLGFFTLASYFLNRVKDDYEFLFLGFTEVIVGTFIFVNSHYSDFTYILVCAMLIFSIANVLNKGYRFKQLVKKGDINYIFKLVSSILMLLIAVFCVSMLYKSSVLGLMIFGYYFIAYGLINLLEPLTAILLKNELILKRVSSSLNSNTVKETNDVKKKSSTKIKEVKNKKPSFSYKEGEVKKSKKERKALKENK